MNKQVQQLLAEVFGTFVLVFIGATDDSRFRAFESKTGKELWVTRLQRAGNANPMTYQGKNGKQYVAIVATNQLVVFALP